MTTSATSRGTWRKLRTCASPRRKRRRKLCSQGASPGERDEPSGRSPWWGDEWVLWPTQQWVLPTGFPKKTKSLLVCPSLNLALPRLLTPARSCTSRVLEKQKRSHQSRALGVGVRRGRHAMPSLPLTTRAHPGASLTVPSLGPGREVQTLAGKSFLCKINLFRSKMFLNYRCWALRSIAEDNKQNITSY